MNQVAPVSAMSDRPTAVTREQLFAEVWAEPMTTVAARYGVSSSFLARVCTRLNVPRPARGYWARLAVGKAGSAPSLPEPRPHDELLWSRDGTPAPVSRALPKAPDPRLPQAIKRKPRRVTEHPLLKGAETHFDGARETRNGYLKPSKRLMVDVVSSKTALGDALALTKELFLQLERVGHSVVIPPEQHRLRRAGVDERERGTAKRHYSELWVPWRPTVVFIGTVAIGLTIYEMSEEIEVRYVDGKYVPVTSPAAIRARGSIASWTSTQETPTGRFCIQAYSPDWRATWSRQWREKKRGELRSKLAQICRELEEEVPSLVSLVEEGERKAEIERQRREAEHAAWQVEEEARRRARALKDSRQELAEIIERWAAEKRVERFFADVASSIAELPHDQHRLLSERLRAARELLGDTDALARLAKWKTPGER